MNALLIVAWGLALFNAGHALAETPPDWLGFAISALVVIIAPIMGIAAAREDRR